MKCEEFCFCVWIDGTFRVHFFMDNGEDTKFFVSSIKEVIGLIKTLDPDRVFVR